jgi:ribosome maturation factor RimP
LGVKQVAAKRLDKGQSGPPLPFSSKSEFSLELKRALEAPLKELGLELASFRAYTSQGRRALEIILDTPFEKGEYNGSKVTIDHCQKVTAIVFECLKSVLGEEDPDFEVSVSSPGLDRKLAGERDFERFTGCLLRLTLKREGATQTLIGRLGASDGEYFLELPDLARKGKPSKKGESPLRDEGSKERAGIKILSFKLSEVVRARLEPDI